LVGLQLECCNRPY